MMTQIITTLIARITAIATSPISDTRSRVPNEVCAGVPLGGVLCIESLESLLVVVTNNIADIVESVVISTGVVVILHSSMKS